MIDSYLNGPRTLSNSRLSYLILSQSERDSELLPTPPRTPSPTSEAGSIEDALDEASAQQHEYDLLICAMHFLGDGMALHAFANDFFGLLGGEKSDEELRDVLHDEWRERWESAPEEVSVCL